MSFLFILFFSVLVTMQDDCSAGKSCLCKPPKMSVTYINVMQSLNSNEKKPAIVSLRLNCTLFKM